MVLGMKAKNRRGPSVQVEYVIFVHDIKPWPPTQSLKTVRSVLVQWENGDRNSGSTSSVTPNINDGKIEFNESFRLTTALTRDMSIKNGDADVFQKNLLEFNLYEPRRDKTVKGQLLGTAIVDLADYGVVKDITSLGVPVNCTRSFRNTAQPVLHLKIQPFDKVRSSSSLRGRFAKEASLDKSVADSVSTLMSEEYADEAEFASLSDEDVSSHSSVTASSAIDSNGGSPSHIKENGTGRGNTQTGVRTENHDLVPHLGKKSAHMRSDAESKETLKDDSSHGISVGSTSDCGNLNNTPASLTDTSELGSMSNSEDSLAPGAKTSILCQADESAQQIQEEVANLKGRVQPKAISKNEASISGTGIISFGVSEKLNSGSDDQPLDGDRPRHVKSVRSPMDSARTNDSTGGITVKQEARVDSAEKRSTSTDTKAQELEQKIKMLERELREAAAIEVALYSVVAEHGSSTNKVHAPARRLSRLYFQAGEGMRRASAAQTAVSGLVVVAKACGNDVPRLTFWLSNCVVLRSIISEAFVEEQLPMYAVPSTKRDGDKKGLNKDSPKLKWKVSSFDKKANRNVLDRSLKDWEDPRSFISALKKVESWVFSRIIESVWWQTLTPHMQSSAAKVIDKIVDSGGRRNYRRTSTSSDQDQVNLSLELWKKAFKDACERICPVRAGGHECGCLPVLAKLIMEQCVARLDVAMFNAILRESVDDIPTDPVSDPISDAKVLPIKAGKSSFGAGAQLKNAIGNWSRWLTDMFGMDDDDAPESEKDDDDDDDDDDGNHGKRHNHDSSFKSFHLLKSLSDLMMLPKDMLLSESIRREVCPTFGVQLIKRVLENFVPDEFCPDPIPDAVFEALNDEDDIEEEEGSITTFPCTAPAVSYSPPPPSSLASLIGGSMGSGSQAHLRRSGSVLRRSNTSDDELDELDSPLNSILSDSPTEMRRGGDAVQNHDKNAIRYKLLRQVWVNGVEM